MKQTINTATPAASEDAPPLTQADFNRARFRVGSQDASRAEWQSAVRSEMAKRPINSKRR